jgi:acetylornithine aminotransferase/acetylornithine/N-succinyldiaminopimelate aminotransferase
VSVTATEKYRLPFAPVVPGVEFVRFNDLTDLERKFDDRVCAVILETIQGEGGIYPASEAFWNRARALTAKHGALLIADEIQCGMGRTGRYFAYQKFSSKPDIVLVAKPLAAGLPLGAILTSEAVATRVSPGVHGTTFGGGPLICATALEFLKIMDESKVLANIRERGAELRKGLEALARKFDFVREVRGEGLIMGVELSINGSSLVASALQHGLLINCTHDFTIRLLPSFLISKAEVRDFLKIFEVLLSETKKTSSLTEVAGTTPNSHAHAAAR